MARPLAKGLRYFPFDVDFDTNEKTEAIMGEFGPKGALIFIYLLSAIYRKGYYLRWTELAKNQLANRVSGATGELVQRVVDRLVAYGTFNKELFNSAEVLSSQRIQDTYLEASKRRKGTKPTAYWINADINPAQTVVNVDINPQTKLNKTKLNKTKPTSVSQTADWAKSHALWEQLWGFPNDVAKTDLLEWTNQFGDDLVAYAIRYAGASAVPANRADRYLDRVFTSYEEAGITTVEQAEAESKAHQERGKAEADQRKLSKPKYGRQPRVEKVPDYNQPGYVPPTRTLTPEEQAKLNARIAALSKPKEEEAK